MEAGGAQRFDAVILAGGTGRRLGGVDKAGIVLAGRPLLDRVLQASADARATVVVGEQRPTIRPVRWAREDPPGGGPVPALAAGLAALRALPDATAKSLLSRHETFPSTGESRSNADETEITVVLATDLPWLRRDDVTRLVVTLQAHSGTDAALFSDPEGRIQPLVAAYRTSALEAALNVVGPLDGTPVRLVVHQLAVVTVPDLGAAGDCDTPDQLAAARAHFDRQG